MPYSLFATLFCREAGDGGDICKRLKALAKPAVFCRSATVFSEGQGADSVFGLSRGLVRLYKQRPDGRRQIIGFALPGDFLSVPFETTYGLSAAAVGKVVLSRFAQRELAELIRSEPDLMRLCFEFVARELKLARDHLMILGFGSAEQRIMMFLSHWRNQLSRLEMASKPVPRHRVRPAFCKPVPLPMMRRDIADFTCLELETVSRTLTRLKEKSAIRVVPGSIFLTGSETEHTGSRIAQQSVPPE